MSNKYRISFEYADAMTNWNWRKQHCILYANTGQEARSECIKLYGLGEDCEYKITKIELIQ